MFFVPAPNMLCTQNTIHELPPVNTEDLSLELLGQTPLLLSGPCNAGVGQTAALD